MAIVFLEAVCMKFNNDEHDLPYFVFSDTQDSLPSGKVIILYFLWLGWTEKSQEAEIRIRDH